MLRLVAFLFVLSYADEATAQAERWAFSSLWGQKIAVSRSSDPDEYAVSVADVIHRVAACDARGYRVCFVTTSISVAIPNDPPEEEATWRELDATFSVEAVIENVKILGVPVSPVYVIRVEHDLSRMLAVPVVRRHRLYFSYSSGLLAFEGLTDGETQPLFLAFQLPSLGASGFSLDGGSD